VDYTSPYNRDLMVYEEGSYTTAYTYGVGLNRISQRISHYPGKTEPGNEGRNAYTDLAMEQYGKLYFHQDRLGSTIRITKENGQTIAWADYDAWGKPRSPQGHDMNTAGIDNAIGFTSYTYDTVLDLYFAQARFYDQNDRRFISVDPIKDGINWYAYCGNNPIVFVDPSGLVPGWRSFEEINLRDGSSMWVDSKGAHSVKRLDDLLYYQQQYMFTDCTYSLKKTNEIRDEFNRLIIVGDTEYSRLINIIRAPDSYRFGSDIAVTKRALEIVKNQYQSSPHGIAEAAASALEDLVLIAVSVGAAYASYRLVEKVAGVFGGALAAKPTAGTVSVSENINFTATAARHMNEAGRAVPVQTLREAISTGQMLPDPQGTSANMFYTTMTKNGKLYNLEVLYDKVANVIMHFQYTPKEIGPLPEISR